MKRGVKPVKPVRPVVKRGVKPVVEPAGGPDVEPSGKLDVKTPGKPIVKPVPVLLLTRSVEITSAQHCVQEKPATRHETPRRGDTLVKPGKTHRETRC